MPRVQGGGRGGGWAAPARGAKGFEGAAGVGCRLARAKLMDGRGEAGVGSTLVAKGMGGGRARGSGRCIHLMIKRDVMLDLQEKGGQHQ